MNGSSTTAQNVVDRLIADPNYRTQVAVMNNYADVAANYRDQRMDPAVLPKGALILKLNQLRVKYPEQVQAILDVPYITGLSDVTDEAYRMLNVLVGSNGLNIDGAKFIGLIAAGIAGLAEIASTIAGGAVAADAAEAEQERLSQLAAINAQESLARAERTKQVVKVVAIGSAIVAAIVLLVLYIRKRNAKA